MDADTDADPNADARGNAIALPGLRPGALKRRSYHFKPNNRILVSVTIRNKTL